MAYNRLNDFTVEEMETIPDWKATILYHHGVWLWNDAEDMDTNSRLILMSKIMILWWRLKGTADEVSEDPRGEAPSHDYYYSCDALSWVKK